MAEIAGLLAGAFDEVWKRFTGRMDGLDDHEYFWEPVPGGWSVRQGEDGRWRIDADGGGGPAPDPLPIPTIAWRIGHIGMTFMTFGSRLFTGRDITIDEVDPAPSAPAARTFLDRHYREWREGMVAIDAERWWRPIGSAFGPYAETSTADLVLHVLDELTHHAAEVALLRDLYRYRHLLGEH